MAPFIRLYHSNLHFLNLTTINKIGSKIVPLQYGTFHNSRHFSTRGIQIITATRIPMNNSVIRVGIGRNKCIYSLPFPTFCQTYYYYQTGV